MEKKDQFANFEFDRDRLNDNEIRWEINRQSRYDILLRSYAIFGLMVGLGSASYFFLSFLRVSLTPQQLLALVIGGSGVALSIFSWAILSVRRQYTAARMYRIRQATLQKDLLDKWNLFENVSKELLSAEKADFSRTSLRSIISSLKQENRITNNDLISLQEALNIRNMIVHNLDGVPSDVMKKSVMELDYIVDKLLSNELPSPARKIRK